MHSKDSPEIWPAESIPLKKEKNERESYNTNIFLGLKDEFDNEQQFGRLKAIPICRASYNCKACRLYRPKSTGWGTHSAAIPVFKLPAG